MSFSEWVSDEIRRRGWTEAEFARQGRITAQAVNQFINGSTQPSLRMYQAVGKAFNMPLEQILRLSGVLPSSVREPRVAYEVNGEETVLALWRALGAADQALVRDLLERLAAPPGGG